MDVEDIPQEIVDLLDERAGKKHSRDGIVLTTLAEILTLYDELQNPVSYIVSGTIGDPGLFSPWVAGTPYRIDAAINEFKEDWT